MSSNITKNWNDLPNEIKMEIIENLNYNERKALRACSLQDKQIVDSTPLKVLEMVSLFFVFEKWVITFHKSLDFRVTEFTSLNIEEIEETIGKELANVTNIDFLRIHLTHIPPSSKLFDSSLKLRVKKLELFGSNLPDCHYFAARNVLEQIEPGYLKDLEFRFGVSNDAIYDMKQVILAEKFSMLSGCIREDQLFKLKATDLYIEDPSVIGASSMNRLLKKRTSSLISTDFQISILVPSVTFNHNEFIKDLPVIGNHSSDNTDEFCDIDVKMLDREYWLRIIGEIQLRHRECYSLYKIKRIKHGPTFVRSVDKNEK